MHTAGHAPGRIALFGSGETSLAGGRAFERLARTLPAPLRIAVLETPAGFEANSDRVAGRIADYLHKRLASRSPEVFVLPARRRNSPFSPEDPHITAPLLHADLIFMGPGSPTYAVRQLTGSLAWHRMLARQRVGATLALASAAVIAAGAAALPIYEIFKAGEDPHWQLGLDLFGVYGLNLVFIPHWNNAEGGEELDTSRCFMGQERFETLRALLPLAARVIGLDEHTVLLTDLESGSAEVMGAGGVTVLWQHTQRRFGAGEQFPLSEFGPFHWPEPDAGLPRQVWEEALAAVEAGPPRSSVPEAVMALVIERQEARGHRDWAAADQLRQRIAEMGWQVRDTAEGPRVEALPGA
jgi:hypothetical protein